METRRDFVARVSALSLVGLSRPLAPDPAAEARAEAAARAWLAIVDGRRYGESWETAGPLLRQAVGKDEWLRALDAIRAPLGPCRSRGSLACKLVEPLSGATGRYAVVQFSTAFQKDRAVETVTPRLDADGRWRVSGYFIRQQAAGH